MTDIHLPQSGPSRCPYLGSGKRGDQMEYRTLICLTYGFFLIATLIVRLLPERYRSHHRIPRRSVFRETWDTAATTLAFVFNSPR